MTSENHETPHGLSLPNIEQSVLEFWQTSSVFERIQAQNKDKPSFWYYDGPPFATGLPHHGHLLASTIKDIVPRYHEMKGHYVPRQFGWDCHGLPIEYEIDKKLGLSTQEAVKKLGHAGYNQECRGIVQRYTEAWKTTLSRLGRWLDFDQPYRTMDTPFMESVWWAVAELWKKDLIYQGIKVVPYSTALQTGLSNFEASSNYQLTQSPSITVLLPLVDEANTFLAIWTTTPWTLPTNSAVCVGPYTYVRCQHPDHDRILIVAKDCLPHLDDHEHYQILSEISGESLVGKAYRPLFDTLDLDPSKAWRVLLDDYVSTEDGTGLVHMAPAHGEDDYRVCQAAGIDTVCLLDDKGCFEPQIDRIGGLYFKEANPVIIQALKSKGLLQKQTTLEHNYPFCPRSDTPLIYRSIPSWYVNVTRIKDRLMQANQSIHWVPDHIQTGRFGKWLEGAKDWAISRNRYWGTPIPIWINDVSGKQHCVGSIAELKSLSGVEVDDLHPEFIDPITFTKPNETGTYRRIPEVLDCWFESGSVPFAQWHYPFENQDLFKKLSPADFVAEGIDQTRGWFYTATIMAVALFDEIPFKHVIVSGIVLAEDGRKMSKRLKNYTAPDELMNTYGADALRLYLIQSNLVRAEEMRFSDQGVKEMTRQVQLPWLNALQFFTTYATIDQWTTDANNKLVTFDHVLDAWLLSRQQSFLDNINRSMEVYQLNQVVDQVCAFLDDLTNTYIRLNRHRFWQAGMPEDKKQAYQLLYQTLVTLTQTMAPFTPFLSEHIYQSLKTFSNDSTFSVHACDYPMADTKHQQPSLESAVLRMQKCLLLGRQQRNDAKIKIKTPLQRLSIIHAHPEVLEAIKPLGEVIKRELNVKTIAYIEDESDFVDLSMRLNTPKLGPILGKRIGALLQSLKKLDQKSIRAAEASRTLVLEGHTLTGDDFIIDRRAKPDSGAISTDSITMALDLGLTPQLIAEGHARELVSWLQKERKQRQFHVSNRIHIHLYANPDLLAIIEAHQSQIQQETLCSQLDAYPMTTTPTSSGYSKFAFEHLDGWIKLEVTD